MAGEIRIINSTKIDTFENEVNNLLKRGWLREGEVQIVKVCKESYSGTHYTYLYHQVMLR